MKFDYFEMLSGRPIYVNNIGHLKSPTLNDILSDSIGVSRYNLFLNFLSWDRDAILNNLPLFGFERGVAVLKKNEVLNVFDIYTIVDSTRNVCLDVLSFFIQENIVWDEKRRRFDVVAAGECDDQDGVIVGHITRDNFDELRSDILQLNYIGLDKDSTPIQHSSEKSKELWEKAQKYLAEQTRKQSSEDKPEYHLGNIVSKLCAAHPSYNLFNIYNLTVFQLYDQFFQYGYVRSASLSEMIFSNHGGDKFRMEDWLKPILKNI